MLANEAVTAILSRFPGPANNSITDAASKEAVEKLIDELLAGGPSAIDGVLATFTESEKISPEEAKARFLLHAAVTYVGATGREAQRTKLAAALTDALKRENAKPYAGYVVRELQWIATADAAPSIAKYLTDEAVHNDAVRTLGTIGGPAAADALVAAWPKIPAKSRASLIQAIGTLREKAGLAALKEAATDTDEAVRIAGVWGLANLGDPSAVPIVLKSCESSGYERTQHTKSLILLAERLSVSNKVDARKLYEHLKSTRTDASDAYLRELAEKGIKALGA